MSRENLHPTRDELMAMAYVDDELVPEQRTAFQARLASEPDLGRQVAVYRKLEVLARRMAPPEPLDHEWQRLRSEPWRRGGENLGWTLCVAGTLGLAAWLVFLILGSGLTLWVKALLIAPCAGFTLLVLLRWRARRRLAPFDPYTEIRR
jgi:anti-sigma factor RsiW